jgi:virginiamycin B lyase
MWFVDSPHHAIGNVTTAGKVTEFPLPSTDPKWDGLQDLAAGPNRTLWFTEVAAGVIGRAMVS